MMMDRHFDDELNSMKTDLLKMATLVEEAIYKSIEALKKRDKDLAQKVVEEDRAIDELELVIEEEAIGMLATRQPMAVDLRFITTGMKINAELERIADLAVNIAQRATELAEGDLPKPLEDIPRLSDVARKMVKSSIDSFVKKDEGLAKQVILSDPEANKLKKMIQEELIDKYLPKDKINASRSVALLLVARHLERICDHATNIAEDVIYMVNARVVKHRKV